MDVPASVAGTPGPPESPPMPELLGPPGSMQLPPGTDESRQDQPSGQSPSPAHAVIELVWHVASVVHPEGSHVLPSGVHCWKPLPQSEGTLQPACQTGAQ
jgi:hypothetical protein